MKRTFSICLLAVLSLTGGVCAAQDNSGKISTNRSQSSPSPANAALICPSAGVTPTKAGQEGTGHHKVILSWNPSVASFGNTGVSYCLYRSQKVGVVKEKPTCDDCEQVNVTPFKGTSCTDEIVLDNATYHYVVIAVDTNGRKSVASNDVPASIPGAKQASGAPINPNPPRSCRD